MKFHYFVWHVIIFFLQRDNKNVLPWHYILNNSQNKSFEFDVCQKVDTAWKPVSCQQKKVDIAQKNFHFDKNKLMLLKKNCDQKSYYFFLNVLLEINPLLLKYSLNVFQKFLFCYQINLFYIWSF